MGLCCECNRWTDNPPCGIYRDQLCDMCIELIIEQFLKGGFTLRDDIPAVNIEGESITDDPPFYNEF